MNSTDDARLEKLASSEDIECGNKQALSHNKSLENGDENIQTDITAEESESLQLETPKILVQRVFQQTQKHTVEKKLNYVIAKSETGISKHVFGGLFNRKFYSYTPENYCRQHVPDLFEYENEELPKIGDKFDCHNSFRLYVDGKAKEWKYYLKCADSHRKSGKDTFVYQCVFARPRTNVFKAKGLRKRTRRVPLHDCPCRVLLKPVPTGANDLTVIYVCNHHDHPLTDEYFYKLQHGRRLHPSAKEELMDLLSLDVDKEVVKKYFESLTGYNMSSGYFANMIVYMKKNKIERQFSLEKLKEISKKIDKIKAELLKTKEHEIDDNPDDDFIQPQSESKDMPSKIAEVYNVLNSFTAPVKTVYKRNRHRFDQPNVDTDPNPTKYRKRKLEVKYNLHKYIKNSDVHQFNTRNKNKLAVPKCRLEKTRGYLFLGKGVAFFNKLPKSIIDLPIHKFKDHVKKTLMSKDFSETPSKNVNVKSRLETRLQQLKYDEETLQNIKHLQDSVRTETNPWVDDHIDNLGKNIRKVKHHKSPDDGNNDHIDQLQIISKELIEEKIVETSENTIETSQCDEIIYESEIVLEDTAIDNESEYVVYENNEIADLPTLEAGKSVSYCIQFDDDVDTNELPNGSYILLENLENMPLQVQATEFATVRIMPDEHQDNSSAVDNQQISNTNDEIAVEHKMDSVIKVIERTSTEIGKGELYEVLETNNKKILRDLVHSIKTKSFGNKLNSRKNKIYKKRKDKTVTGKIYDDYSSTDVDTKLENEDLSAQLSFYGVDLDQLKENDYYVIVVDKLKKEYEMKHSTDDNYDKADT